MVWESFCVAGGILRIVGLDILGEERKRYGRRELSLVKVWF